MVDLLGRHSVVLYNADRVLYSGVMADGFTSASEAPLEQSLFACIAVE